MERFTDFCIYVNKYLNKDTVELKSILNINSKSKSINYMLSKAICDSYVNKDFFETLAYENKIMIKTIQLNEKGNPEQAMSFSPIDFMNIINEEWGTSTLRCLFENNFLFFVFKKEADKNYLRKICLWRMPVSDLEGEVKEVWIDTVNKLSTGNVTKGFKDGKPISNLPAQSQTKICHVRPHGTDGGDIKPLPTKDIQSGYNYYAKQSFWLNREYIKKIAEETTNI